MVDAEAVGRDEAPEEQEGRQHAPAPLARPIPVGPRSVAAVSAASARTSQTTGAARPLSFDGHLAERPVDLRRDRDRVDPAELLAPGTGARADLQDAPLGPHRAARAGQAPVDQAERDQGRQGDQRHPESTPAILAGRQRREDDQAEGRQPEAHGVAEVADDDQAAERELRDPRSSARGRSTRRPG